MMARKNEEIENVIGKDVVELTEAQLDRKDDKLKRIANWVPKTAVGKLVKNGEITSIEQVFEKGLPIIETEIIDTLLPHIEEKLIEFSKTTKVRRAGRLYAFRAIVLVGDGNSYIGLGIGKDKERLPALRKATKNAKLSLFKVHRGCGSWQCGCHSSHSIPFKSIGKCASVTCVLMPAPKGTGLVVADNIKDVMRFAGVKDVWSKTRGNSTTKLNLIGAAVDALANTAKYALSDDIRSKLTRLAR